MVAEDTTCAVADLRFTFPSPLGSFLPQFSVETPSTQP